MSISSPALSSPNRVEVLDDVLAPLAAAEFFENYWGRKFLHQAGSPGRFSALFPWPVLNDMLETHRFVAPRLRMTHGGKAVAPDAYTKNGHLRSAELTGLLRDGATLIVAAVDEVHAPLKALCQKLSRALQARINVNLYAGWRTSHGFDVHWDSHDVFVLQVAGKKIWKIYEPTEPYPIKDSVELGRTPPTTEPIWDGVLKDGEMLYMPRGWWHVAIPVDEPTLHLTFGIHKPTGVDVIRWVTESFQNDPRVRMDVPISGDAAGNTALLEAIRTAVREAFEPGDLLTRFRHHSADIATQRPYFNLPTSATPEVLPESDTAIIFVPAAQGIDLRERVDGAIDIAFDGKLLTFAGAARPLFTFLAEELPAPISLFYQRFKNQFELDTLRQFLTEMAKQGVIAVRE
jgi:ribosomal protein L16 Arg81 hydroxylase